jgi:DNA-binding beta-propeller fold protein YncE
VYVKNPDGSLVLAPGSPVPLNTQNPVNLAISPDGSTVFVVNQGANTVSQYSIDVTTGRATLLGPTGATGAAPAAALVDPAGNFLFVANQSGDSISVFSFGLNNSLINAGGSPFADGASPAWVALDASGKFLYAVNSTANSITFFQVNATTGLLTAGPGSPFATSGLPSQLVIATE